MRPYALAVALLAGAAAPATAIHGPCRASAEPPTAQHAFGAEASGSFRCDTARPLLSVEVCLEVLAETGWEPVACETGEAVDAAEVSATAYGCRYGLYLIRSTARGVASTGERGYAASLPDAYLCTPL